MYTRILLAHDQTPCSQEALVRAIHLARRTGAALHIVFAEVLHDDAPVTPTPEQPVADNFLALVARQASAARLGLEGIEVRVVVVRGVTAASALLDYATRHDADLIVMGTHRRRGISRLFLGSVAEEVIRLANCPVMTVHPAAADTPVATAGFARILVGVDFSESSVTALETACHMAEMYGARVDILHVIEEAVFPAVYGIEPVSIGTPTVIQSTREALDDLSTRDAAAKVETGIHVTIGAPSIEIINMARDLDADLIVLATHGLTGMRRVLMGSVAERVVRLAPCPVLVVKAADAHATEQAPARTETALTTH